MSVHGVDFAYRQRGPDDGVPLILLNHLSAVLDNWDPRVVDGLAARRRVITYDNRGVGASGGSAWSAVSWTADVDLGARSVRCLLCDSEHLLQRKGCAGEAGKAPEGVPVQCEGGVVERA
ncbi:hypothetical protein ABT063_37920 [Streptomyces sp. NPDC002838]|uniref:alpha/beta fold hydrolase n=1 Tax=Streptomyces sp. NPDC002838 TaxID=3154436 RepID=UPI0033174741